jgi:16S rRNA processing protein RimM
MTEDNLLSVGKIIGAHGIRGNLKLYPYVESLKIFKSGHRIVLRDPNGKEESYAIKWGQPYKNVYRLLLTGIDSRDAAENLIGSEIFIKKSLLPDLESEEHYWFEIIGLEVFQIDDVYLGKIESILQTGSNDVYVVKNPGTGNETLIPAIQSVVTKIDIENNRMLVDLPEGL